ncbi:MAG: DUF1080 domain-containing protein [Verrucomicrobiales bacterium]
MKKLTIALWAAACALSLAPLTAEDKAATKDGFTVIFDGKSLDGWKVAEKEKPAFRLENGAVVAYGPRNHLFYVGDDKPFKNFIFRAQVQTKKNSNGGIFFHTAYQAENWPAQGHEAQVNNTFNKDPRKSGSIYKCKDVMNVSPVGDDVWWDYEIKVEGRKVTVSFDGKVVNEYVEPEAGPGQEPGRKLGSGTFALQAHDPDSTVMYKNIRVKRLPD